jgi:hypothetical protein
VRNINGKLYARFSDKSELEFESRAEMKAWIRQILDDNTIKALLLAAVLEDADGVPLNQVDGKRATLDFATSPFLTIAQE